MGLTKNLNEDLSMILTHGQCAQTKVYFLQFKPETGDTLIISNQADISRGSDIGRGSGGGYRRGFSRRIEKGGGSAGGCGRGLAGSYSIGVRRRI